MSGWIKLYRGWSDNPALSSPERKLAWLWLLENACWKEREFNINGTTITLERGQMAYSLRQISDELGWSKSSVERFFTRLKTETMIEIKAGHGKNIITICNYTKYQSDEIDERDSSGTPSGTGAGQERDTNKEGKKERRINNNNYAFSGEVIRLNENDFSRWQRAYPGIDLAAVLQSRDDWIRDQPADVKKRWFQSTSNWLAKKQQDKTSAKVEKEDPWASLEFGHA